jgi:hypothetical protein
MLDHIFSSIIGQGFPQQCGNGAELVREPVPSTLRIGALYACQEDQARRPLHQGVDAKPLRAP